jgi:hypothetical protein
MNSRSLQATLLFARHCVNSAKDAEKRRLFLAAHNLRKAAREALESVELADVTPVDPETARKREIARAYARTVVAGFGRVD